MRNPITEFGKTAQGLARNPLGIIALFIVLVYGIAAMVLSTSVSNLQPEERAPLVWFLVLFPLIVLAVFGWLVSRHHSKLYAPRDFQSDTGFLKTLSPEAQRARLGEEVAQFDVLESAQEQPDKIESPSTIQRLPAPRLDGSTPSGPAVSEVPDSGNRRAQTSAKVLLAQELALRQLESELGFPLDRQASVAAPDAFASFDGALIRDGRLTGVEVKLLRGTTAKKNLRNVVESVLAIFAHLQAAVRSKDKTKYIVVLVLDDVSQQDRGEICSRASAIVASSGLPAEVRCYELRELQETFGVPAT